MDADPGQVIRSLRQALEMSQAEFARAAGWSPSTISSWECGRAKPSRLAFKTILAFAEERGVRYRPRTPTNALITLPASAPTHGATSTATPGPRAAFRPLVYPDLTDTARPQRPTAAEPPRWSAEANFRLTLGARHERLRSGFSRRALEVAIVVVGFAVAYGLREPVQHLLRGPAPTRAVSVTAASSAASVPAAARAPAPPASDVAPANDASDGEAVAAVAPPRLAAPAVVPAEAMPQQARASARLESVMAIGGAGRATFRTANDAVTVVTGEWLGGQRVAAITADDVTLVDRAGTSHRVQVGQHTPFD
jgi:transcriptional regulator with XRE-family HTH domain